MDMIPIENEKIVRPMMKLSSVLATNDLECEGDDCERKLSHSEAFVYLDKESKMFKVSCGNCMKIASSIGKAIYYDTYDVFQKRKKIGMIAQLYQELIYDKLEEK